MILIEASSPLTCSHPVIPSLQLMRLPRFSKELPQPVIYRRRQRCYTYHHGFTRCSILLASSLRRTESL